VGAEAAIRDEIGWWMTRRTSGASEGLLNLVGYEVVEAMDPVSAAKQAQKLAKAQTPFIVITDLGMPTSSGSSYQGGSSGQAALEAEPAPLC
jgi:CheY-like chemotaxis protein